MSSYLVPVGPDAIEALPFKVEALSLADNVMAYLRRDDLTFETWAGMGYAMRREANKDTWARLAWLAYGLTHYDDTVAQYADLTGYAAQTLANKLSVFNRWADEALRARVVLENGAPVLDAEGRVITELDEDGNPVPLSPDRITFGFYESIPKRVGPQSARVLLTKAEDGGWTREDLREEVRRLLAEADDPTPEDDDEESEEGEETPEEAPEETQEPVQLIIASTDPDGTPLAYYNRDLVASLKAELTQGVAHAREELGAFIKGRQNEAKRLKAGGMVTAADGQELPWEQAAITDVERWLTLAPDEDVAAWLAYVLQARAKAAGRA